MPVPTFPTALREAIHASSATQMPYAQALLDDCQQGMHAHAMSSVLESLEWLADQYQIPTDACREVMEQAFSACDPQHGQIFPATLSVFGDQSVGPIHGWVRYHTGIPYDMPVYLDQETAAKLMNAKRCSCSSPMEIETAHGIKSLVLLHGIVLDIDTIDLPQNLDSQSESQSLPF